MFTYYIEDTNLQTITHLIYNIYKKLIDVDNFEFNEESILSFQCSSNLDSTRYIHQLSGEDFLPELYGGGLGNIFIDTIPGFIPPVGSNVQYFHYPTNILQMQFSDNLIGECIVKGKRYKAVGALLNKPINSYNSYFEENENGEEFINLKKAPNGFSLTSYLWDPDGYSGSLVRIDIFFISEDFSSILQLTSSLDYYENNSLSTINIYSVIGDSISFDNCITCYTISDNNELIQKQVKEYSSYSNFSSSFVSGVSTVQLPSTPFLEIIPNAVVAYQGQNIISDNETSPWTVDPETGIITAGAYKEDYGDNDVSMVRVGYWYGDENSIKPTDIEHLNIYALKQ